MGEVKKFKGWIVEKNEMGYMLTLDELFKLNGKNTDQQIIWLQYTGIKDSEGIEIWEGDLLKVWIDGELQTKPYEVTSAIKLYYNMNNPYKHLEFTRRGVIGNIYENPELQEVE